MKKYRTLWLLFWNFVKISSVSVGGGLTMIPLIEKYFTPPHGDLTPEDIVDTVAFGQSMPGIIAVNMSGFIGMRLAGVAGAVAASFGVIIVPFLLIMFVLGGFYKKPDRVNRESRCQAPHPRTRGR